MTRLGGGAGNGPRRRLAGLAALGLLLAGLPGVPGVSGAPAADLPELAGGPPAAIRPAREPRAAVPAAAPAAVSLEVPGLNERVSLGPKGEQLAATQGLDPAISADGRFVAYRTIAIVGSRSAYAIRRYDRDERTTIQIYPLRGTATDGFPLDPGRGILGPPTISADGRFVAFAEAVQGGWRILMWSADQGVFAPLVGTKVANLTFSTLPSLSEDGRYLAFLGGSGATLSARLPPRYYRLDRDTGAAVVVGIDTLGRQIGSTFSEFYGGTAISADGDRVVFTDQSPSGDRQVRQVWLRDVPAGRTILVSATSAGREASADSFAPSISADGQVVVFQSDADDLVPDDRNGAPDIYAWREGVAVRRVSVAPGGTEGNGPSVQPAISGDGRHVAFASGANSLVPGDTTGPLPPGADAANPTDIFAADLVSGRLARVSVGIGPREPDGSSSAPTLSRNGRFVAFMSSAANLVPDDSNETTDVFVRERIAELTLAANPTDFGSAPVAAPPGVTRTVTVTSTGGFAARVTALAPAGANAEDFLVSADGCTGTMLYSGDACTVQLLFLPLAPGTRTAQLRVSATTPSPPVPARLVGVGGAAKITVKPAVGPPGTVTIVTGTGFGPGVPIALTWSTGISPAPLEPVVTDAKGGFVAQLLVLPRDRIGTRQVRATRSGPGAPAAPVTARFLVVAGTAAPPISGLVQVFADTLGRPIILRR